MVHATKPGPKTIRLPHPKTVTDITTDEQRGPITSWKMDLAANETRIFLLD